MTAPNPIHAMLDAAGLPWLTPRAELMGRFGVRRCPWLGVDIVLADMHQPFLTSLIRPLEFRVRAPISAQHPPAEFIGVSWFAADALQNLARTKDQLAPWLGLPEPLDSSNTHGWLWRAGPARVELLVWPPELQRAHVGVNDTHRREPRLITGCHIDIKTGYRPRPTPQEQAWLDSYTPVVNFAAHASGPRPDVKNDPASEYDLEFVREPAPDLSRFSQTAGCSADGQAVIFCHEQLHLIPARTLTRLRVQRIRRGRGSGGAWLHADCRGDEAGAADKALTIAAAPRADDLNDPAGRLAAALGKPLDLGAYQEDD
jgi:hypothetical protein